MSPDSATNLADLSWHLGNMVEISNQREQNRVPDPTVNPVETFLSNKLFLQKCLNSCWIIYLFPLSPSDSLQRKAASWLAPRILSIAIDEIRKNSSIFQVEVNLSSFE